METINMKKEGKMFTIEEWMFQLGLSYGQLVVFAYVYNNIKTNSWNPKEISCIYLGKLMHKQFQNIHACLKDLCKKGLLIQSGTAYNNCCMYSLTPNVFEVSKDVPVAYRNDDIDYSEQITQVMRKFKAVLGVDVYPREQIEQYAVPLLAAGQTADDLCAVIECKAKEWREDLKMCAFIRPQTLFGNKYDTYLRQSKISGITKPDIDISFIYRLYSERFMMTPPEDLTEWCLRTLRDNPDMSVAALGWTVASIYNDLEKGNDTEWLQKKMASTKVLTQYFPRWKANGIACQEFGENPNP